MESEIIFFAPPFAPAIFGITLECPVSYLNFGQNISAKNLLTLPRIRFRRELFWRTFDPFMSTRTLVMGMYGYSYMPENGTWKYNSKINSANINLYTFSNDNPQILLSCCANLNYMLEIGLINVNECGQITYKLILNGIRNSA